MNLPDLAEREVAELHEFFGRWFRGELPGTVDALARFQTALHPEFEMISPGGEVLGREAVLTAVRDAHGAHGRAEIRIREHRHRMTIGDAALVTYQEWQTRGGQARGRQSSAVLLSTPRGPRGVQWLHLHETWLEAPR